MNEDEKKKRWYQFELKALGVEKKIANAIRYVIGSQETKRRKVFNFTMRSFYRISSIITAPITLTARLIFGRRGDRRHSFLINTWDLVLGNFGRQKAIKNAQEYVIKNNISRDQELDIELDIFRKPFQKHKHLNRVFNTVSTIGYPAGLIVTTKIAIIKPTRETITAAGYAWTKMGALCAPKIQSVKNDCTEAATDFKNIFNKKAQARIDKGIEERAEHARLLFYQEMASHNYTVNPDHLNRNNIENFDKFARIIEDKIQYKPKTIKIGKLKFRW